MQFTQSLKLYRELAEWYPLLTPVSDYVEKAAIYYRLFESYCTQIAHTPLYPSHN